MLAHVRTSTAEPVQLRWQAFEGIASALATMHGPGKLERVVPHVSPEAAEAITMRRRLARAWYPVAWYAELHDAAQAQLGGGRRLHREIGRLATEHDLRTLHRFILQFVSPRALLAQSQRIWSLYSDRGTVTHETLGPTCIRVRFAACPGVSLPVWEDIGASTAAILGACGARSVSHALVSVSAEHGSCVAQYDWRS